MEHTPKKKPIPWLLMIFGISIPIFIVGMAFLAAKSDAKTKREYDRQHAEIAKRFAQQKADDQAKNANPVD